MLGIMKSQLLHVMYVDGKIRGMTILNYELFIVTHLAPYIQVYEFNENTFIKTRQIQIPELKEPRGLVSCDRFGCLYISDFQLKVLHKFIVQDNACSKWSVSGTPEGLHV